MTRPGISRHGTNKETAETVKDILNILHKWGIHTLGDFIRLDKEQLRARLGLQAVRLWKRARGQSTRPLKLIHPPESFSESFEFDYEVETVQPLLFVLRRFLEQLALRLRGIYLVAKQLTLRIDFANKQNYQRRFEIPQPTNDVHLLFRMLYTHLEDFKSEHPIIAVSLEAEPTKAGQQQFGLFETALRNPSQLYATLARLIALLGTDRVGTPVLEETYRPDAFHLAPFAWDLSAPAFPSKTKRVVALRRLRPSPATSVLLDNNKPIHLRSPQFTASVARETGPYLASGNWWDNHRWSCHEWDVEFEKGTVCRIHSEEERWQVDGIYD